MTPEQTPFLEIEHLRAGYRQKDILKDVSFQAEQGQLTALLGANGCGKTTLLKALCRQIPYTGSCLLEGKSLEGFSPRALARQITYIPQRSGVGISLPVLEVVLMGFNPVLGVLQHPSEGQKNRAREALAAVGMEDRAGEDYQRLSEGQKQLVILARAMVEDARLLLLDEPESSLDFFQRHRMMRLLSDMVAGSGKAGLVTLHDPALALEYCRRLALLKDGVCIAVLHPASDSVARMEQALAEIYGPIRLKQLEDTEKPRLVMLPAE